MTLQEERNYDGFFEGTAFWGAVGMPNLTAPLSEEPWNPVPVTGYHVLSTAPFAEEHPGAPFVMRSYALVTAQLSAACWRRYNGPIYLVTDRTGAEYARKTGLAESYDGVKVLLSGTNRGIQPNKFWASSKILAWEQLELPCAVIDMDMVIWRPLPLAGNPLAAAHIEHINERFYPDPSFFVMSRNYRFPEAWEREEVKAAKALNTSLLYMEDESLRKYYTEESIRFMKFEIDTPDDGVQCMVYAEQRILGMCAAVKGITPKVFLNYDDPLASQNWITHTWSGKRVMHCIPEAEKIFIALCREKLDQLNNKE